MAIFIYDYVVNDRRCIKQSSFAMHFMPIYIDRTVESLSVCVHYVIRHRWLHLIYLLPQHNHFVHAIHLYSEQELSWHHIHPNPQRTNDIPNGVMVESNGIKTHKIINILVDCLYYMQCINLIRYRPHAGERLTCLLNYILCDVRGREIDGESRSGHNIVERYLFIVSIFGCTAYTHAYCVFRGYSSQCRGICVNNSLPSTLTT